MDIRLKQLKIRVRLDKLGLLRTLLCKCEKPELVSFDPVSKDRYCLKCLGHWSSMARILNQVTQNAFQNKIINSIMAPNPFIEKLIEGWCETKNHEKQAKQIPEG